MSPQTARRRGGLALWSLTMIVCASGCYSPYHADRGALFGGATGAGVGAIVGNAVGNTAAGALIGGGVGALSGAAIGQGMDDIEARNRAEIAAALGRQVPPGAVTIDDVMAMTKAGVSEELIAGHIRASGVARPLTSQDIIALNNSGVPPSVIQAMQNPPQPIAQQPVAGAAPVMVAQPVYPAPVYAYPAYYPPRVGWGVSYSTCR